MLGIEPQTSTSLLSGWVKALSLLVGQPRLGRLLLGGTTASLWIPHSQLAFSGPPGYCSLHVQRLDLFLRWENLHIGCLLCLKKSATVMYDPDGSGPAGFLPFLLLELVC